VAIFDWRNMQFVTRGKRRTNNSSSSGAFWVIPYKDTRDSTQSPDLQDPRKKAYMSKALAGSDQVNLSFRKRRCLMLEVRR
jgi:hypothetical protein